MTKILRCGRRVFRNFNCPLPYRILYKGDITEFYSPLPYRILLRALLYSQIVIPHTLFNCTDAYMKQKNIDTLRGNPLFSWIVGLAYIEQMGSVGIARAPPRDARTPLSRTLWCGRSSLGTSREMPSLGCERERCERAPPG